MSFINDGAYPVFVVFFIIFILVAIWAIIKEKNKKHLILLAIEGIVMFALFIIIRTIEEFKIFTSLEHPLFILTWIVFAILMINLFILAIPKLWADDYHRNMLIFYSISFSILICLGILSFIMPSLNNNAVAKVCVVPICIIVLGLKCKKCRILLYHGHKYKDIYESLDGEILAKEKLNINCSGTLRNGYFILTQDSVYLFIRDNEPYVEDRIPKRRIKEIHVNSFSNLYLVISERTYYSIFSKRCKSLIKVMQKHGWIID